jgi:hypothetical protein
MPISTVSICNSALRLVGAQSITSLDDAVDGARLCKQFFTPCFEEMLYLRDWGFARKRATLAELLTPPAFGYAHAYQLPTDLVRIIGSNIPDGCDWQREGDKIYTDETSVGLLYLYYCDTPSLWSHGFRRALEYDLASKIAYPLTKDAALAQYLFTQFEDALADAASLDGQEGHAMTAHRTDFISPRAGGGVPLDAPE